MEIGLISCWYKEKSCGNFAYNLSIALERIGLKVSILSANCLCYRDDPFNPDLFFSACRKIKFADFYWRPAPRIINHFRTIPRLAGDALKGRRYINMMRLPILNYQQTQGSFGFLPLFSFLRFPSNSRRVVTIHEIDSIQRQFKLRNMKFSTIRLNKIYNSADAVIVQNNAMKKILENLGVFPEKIHVIPHGTHIPQLKSYIRDQIIFCGGHRLTKGKGFDTFLQALLILKEEGITPKVLIYGLNLGYGQEEGKHLVSQLGITDQVKWFDYNFDDKSLFEEFQKAMFMVIPYATSEAGAAVTAAMANAVPVIATRNVGLPEYLGKYGIFLNREDPVELSQKMLLFINNSQLRKESGEQLYMRAAALYSWDVVARMNLELYQKLLKK